MIKQFEFLAKKSIIRTFLQETFEVRLLKRHVNLSNNETVLEIGCGKGTGTRLIKKYFKPEKTYGLDIDPEVIKTAKERTKDTDIVYAVGDAAKIPYKNNMFDVVFDFGVIYHIPNWTDCLKEIKRVLKPGGQLIFEEISLEAFEKSWGKAIRKFFDRPHKIKYRREAFLDFLEKEGWRIATKKIFHPLGLEYFIVIAKKSD